MTDEAPVEEVQGRRNAPQCRSVVRYFGGERWGVECLVCDFDVTNLSSFEAADDTSRWHVGLPSLIGNMTSG